MSDALIQAENVSKKFCRDLKKSLWYGVRDSVSALFGGNASTERLREGEFWANKEISFELKRGECLGLIGRNGAGKTTLLKMLNGLIQPDEGLINIRGSVGALIALGAGFNPVLTGRENVLVNGSVLGRSRRQTEDCLEEIIEFSELQEFIDSPTRNYSSGMQVRLGFAIAVILIKPDVLILDEVLAVGDVGFRNRCYSRISSLMSRAAVVLVSHSMEHIGQCATAVGLMRKGKMSYYDDIQEGIQAYNKANSSDPSKSHTNTVKSILDPVKSAEVTVVNGEANYGASLEVFVDIESSADIDDIELFFTAQDLNERPAMCWNSARSGERLNLTAGRQRISFCIEPLLMHDGQYKWSFVLGRRNSLDRPVSISCGGMFRVHSQYRPLNNTPYVPHSTRCEVYSQSESSARV